MGDGDKLFAEEFVFESVVSYCLFDLNGENRRFYPYGGSWRIKHHIIDGDIYLERQTLEGEDTTQTVGKVDGVTGEETVLLQVLCGRESSLRFNDRYALVLDSFPLRIRFYDVATQEEIPLPEDLQRSLLTGYPQVDRQGTIFMLEEESITVCRQR